MALTAEQRVIVDRVAENCKKLGAGYMEKVEYVLEVAYHRGNCRWYGKSSQPKDDCDCPVTREKRVRQVRRKGLLDQLREFAANKDTDRNPKAERGAPRVKTAGKPPGDMAGFFALDELMCDIPYVVDRALEEAGCNRTWAAIPVHDILEKLSGQVGDLLLGGRPDVARTLDRAAARWVESARSTLKIDSAESIFAKIVCGNCGGALGTPWGNAGESDVSCLGHPDAPPCGETYPPGEWVRLLEDHRQREAS